MDSAGVGHQRRLLYKFQASDVRDYKFVSKPHSGDPHLEIAILTTPTKTTTVTTPASPPSYTIPYLPPILDQGNLGDCVPNAFAYSVASQTKNGVRISRLMNYAICRILDGTSLDADDGTAVRSACQAITGYGVASETIFPYNVNLYATLPPLSVFQGSRFFKKFTYSFVKQDLSSLKNCLALYGAPIIFGLMVYSSFMTNAVAQTGMIPMPNLSKETMLGGHCMTIVGYSDSSQTFVCANSWGTGWGKGGYCNLPYAYLLNPQLTGDFCFTQFVY